MLPTGSNNSHYVVTIWAQNSPKIDSKLLQSCHKVFPKLSDSCPKVVPMLFQISLKVFSKLSLSCSEWCPSVVQVGPKWCPNVVHIVPEWCQVVSTYVTMWPRDALNLAAVARTTHNVENWTKLSNLKVSSAAAALAQLINCTIKRL